MQDCEDDVEPSALPACQDTCPGSSGERESLCDEVNESRVMVRDGVVTR